MTVLPRFLDKERKKLSAAWNELSSNLKDNRNIDLEEAALKKISVDIMDAAIRVYEGEEEDDEEAEDSDDDDYGDDDNNTTGNGYCS